MVTGQTIHPASFRQSFRLLPENAFVAGRFSDHDNSQCVVSRRAGYLLVVANSGTTPDRSASASLHIGIDPLCDDWGRFGLAPGQSHRVLRTIPDCGLLWCLANAAGPPTRDRWKDQRAWRRPRSQNPFSGRPGKNQSFQRNRPRTVCRPGQKPTPSRCYFPRD